MISPSNYSFRQIGIVESCFKERFGTPRQSGLVPLSKALIKLNDDFREALEGLESFSHVWVIFVFHQNTNKRVLLKIHPPRLNGKKIGVLATRSPHRPNPIGLSVVQILEIRDSSILVGGVDFIEGTPILDIKPYLPSFDSIADANEGWLKQNPLKRMPVEFEASALDKISEYAQTSKYHSKDELQTLIKQTLELDPRPNFYKGTPENPDPYMNEYGFCLEDFNVVFQMRGGTAFVTDLTSGPRVGSGK